MNILLLEPNIEIAREIEAWFAGSGHSLIVADCADHLLHELRESRGYAVIVDMLLLSSDNYRLLAEIKRNNRMTYVIMLSDTSSWEAFIHCIHMGIDECVLKPLDGMEELEMAVAHAARRQQYWQDMMKRFQEIRFAPNLLAYTYGEIPINC